MAKGDRRRRRPAGGRADRPAAAPEPVQSPEPDVVASGVDELDRTDLLYAAGATVAAAALFASTFSTHVSLGDAPESVAGVKTLGVLHAPGYPSYVAVAGLFARIFALGGWAARVNAFSLVCAALTVGAVFLLARRFGASRLGGALGALTLATTASFWFNADFAKHYAFSGLLVTLAALAATGWLVAGRSRGLIVAGALLGVCAGASWELAAIMAAGLLAMAVFGDRRAPGGVVAGAIGSLAVLAVASYGFMMWRATRHPAVNWGEATNVHRLVDQVTQRDFRGQSVNATHHNVVVQLAIRLPSYLAIVARDLGLGAVVVAIFGIVLGVRRLGRGRWIWLLVVGVLNLIAVAFATGVDRIAGFVTGLVAGGYLIDLLVVVAVLVALGTTPLVDLAADRLARATTPDRYKQRVAATADRYRPYIAVALFVVVLAPSVVVHARVANHRQPPLADDYAQRILSELPHGAVLFMYQGDQAFPIVYRQSVFGDRPDVDVVVATSLQFEWYRDQIARQLHLKSVPLGDPISQMKKLIPALASRPAFVDQGVIDLYRDSFDVRLRGLVGEVVKTKAEAADLDRDELASRLLAADKADGVAGHPHIGFPNAFMHFFYGRAHIELAKLYARAGELPKARTELARSLDDYPYDNTTKLVLQFSGQPNEKESQVVKVISAL